MHAFLFYLNLWNFPKFVVGILLIGYLRIRCRYTFLFSNPSLSEYQLFPLFSPSNRCQPVKPGTSIRTNSQHSVDEGNHFSSCRDVGDSWTSKSRSMIFYSKPPRITDTCLYCSWDCGRGGERVDLFMPTNLPNEFSSAVWNFVDFIIGSFIFQPTISKPRAKTAHWVIIS